MKAASRPLPATATGPSLVTLHSPSLPFWTANLVRIAGMADSFHVFQDSEGKPAPRFTRVRNRVSKGSGPGSRARHLSRAFAWSGSLGTTQGQSRRLRQESGLRPSRPQ